MKQLTTFLLFFCFSTLAAQNTTWFPPGAHWSYDELGLGGPGSSTIDMTGTAVINGQTCAQLTVQHTSGISGGTTNTTDYMLSRNDSVFLYWNGNFELIYDFTRMPGDSSPLFLGAIFDHYAVVDTGRAEWQGITLRYQDVVLTGSGQTSAGIRLWERIGGKHLYFLEDSSPLLEVYYDLICYQDNSVPACLPPFGTGYTPMTAPVKSQWKESHFNFANYTDYEYLMQGDTFIQAVGAGRKVHYRDANNPVWRVFGLLREDPILEEVSFVRINNIAPKFTLITFPVNQWVPLYDYSVAVGDTIAWKPLDKVVKAIDSVQMADGSFRKRILFDGPYFIYTPYWITGLGGTTGLFMSYQENWTSDTGHFLRCYSENDVVMYTYSGAIDCVVDAFEPFSQGIAVGAFPNPSEGHFTVEIPEEVLPATVTVLDITGREISRTRQISTMQSMELPGHIKGTMIIRIQGAHEEQGRKLLVIE